MHVLYDILVLMNTQHDVYLFTCMLLCGTESTAELPPTGSLRRSSCIIHQTNNGMTELEHTNNTSLTVIIIYNLQFSVKYGTHSSVNALALLTYSCTQLVVSG